MANKLARGGQGKEHDIIYYHDPVQFGNYQYIPLDEIVKNFTAVYVGQNKVFTNISTGDINYHAHRALQELSYDTLKSCKSQEITLPPSLQMVLPADYVNYTKITWSDAHGIEHVLYPTSKTSNPNTVQQDENGEYLFAGTGSGREGELLQDNHSRQDEPYTGGYALKIHASWGFHPAGGDWFIKGNYSGPFRMKQTFKRVQDNYQGAPPMPNVLDEPYLKDGMSISNPMFQPDTKTKDVTAVSVASHSWGDIYETQFYIDKPTLVADNNLYLGTPNAQIMQQYISIDDLSKTWGSYKSSSNNSVSVDSSTTTNLAVDADNYFLNTGQRYGLEPQHAQANGSFFIDCHKGLIHFNSSLSGKTIVLHYLSDHHGTDGEAIVHKFAEEAMYKWIAYGCAQARTDVDPGTIARFKREKQVETRKAKLRLSNIKIEEISQIMRGKSKFINH
tara:strand:+ start:742 stop:2082 length:1341 start_codon:yes stop_codon:yes gene_type:complete